MIYHTVSALVSPSDTLLPVGTVDQTECCTWYPTLLRHQDTTVISLLPVGFFLRRFQHCTGHITTGSWKGRGNQYIQFVRVLYKLPTNSKQLPAFPLEAVTGIEPQPQRWEARVLPLCHRGPVLPVGIVHQKTECCAWYPILFLHESISLLLALPVGIVDQTECFTWCPILLLHQYHQAISLWPVLLVLIYPQYNTFWLVHTYSEFCHLLITSFPCLLENLVASSLAMLTASDCSSADLLVTAAGSSVAPVG